MSHSTVTVVIPHAESALDAEAQLEDLLAPFDENEPGPTRVEWQTQEQVDETVKHYREGDLAQYAPHPYDEFVTDDETRREWTRQVVGTYCAGDTDLGVYDSEGDRYGYETTYNEDSRWDWWALGGRWSGLYLLKKDAMIGARKDRPLLPDAHSARTQLPSVSPDVDAILGAGSFFGDDPDADYQHRADLARKGAIDLIGMRAEAIEGATKTYDKFEEATKGLEVAPRFRDLIAEEKFRAGIDPDMDFADFLPDEDLNTRREKYDAPVNAARERYHAHPWVKALQEAKLLGWLGDPHEDFRIETGGRDAFIESARLNAGTTFALLLDGEWHERGRMGWFGMAHDEQDPDEWVKRFWELLETVPDDAYLAVVDVHI